MRIFARDTVIVTSRPIDYPLSSFMQVRLNPLAKRESLAELNNRAPQAERPVGKTGSAAPG